MPVQLPPAVAQQSHEVSVDEPSYDHDQCDRASDHSYGEQHAEKAEENVNYGMHMGDAINKKMLGRQRIKES